MLFFRRSNRTTVVDVRFIHDSLFTTDCRGRSPCLPGCNMPGWWTNRADTGVRPYRIGHALIDYRGRVRAGHNRHGAGKWNGWW
ncbi:hypothetical protein [Candidatus Electrothrix sp.]|uniref:hypothetical protein n=1 Tax=Candidatus Electrothrix sp. TaxID=2170559 RepID=UPI0040562CD0